jgi:Uma2 family endonuclease
MSEPRAFVRAAVGLLDGLGGDDSVLLDGLTWDEYVWFDLQRTERRPNVMLAYADGKLGFRGNVFEHESRCSRLRDLLLNVALACSIQHLGAGRTTFRRHDLKVCVEADESFYVEHWEAVRFLDDIDLAVHPPPDLAVEIEEPRSPLDKLPIHAALGVPEVWVIDRGGTTFHWLRPAGTNREPSVGRSRC